MSATQTNLMLQRWKPTKDGKFPVVIRIYSDKKRRYYRTGVSATERDWDEDNSEIIGRSRDNKTIQKLLKKAKEIVSKILVLNDEFDFDEFSREFSEGSPMQSGENFLVFWQSVIKDLRAENRTGTADSYQNALNKFKKFVKDKPIPIRQISQLTFEKFRIFMVQSGQTTNGVGIYLRSMSAVYGRALRRKLVKPDEDPRKGFKVKSARTPKKAIKQEEMRLLWKLDLSQQPFVEESRDMFLFSYFCQGMNLKDMCLLSWERNFVEERLYYARGKTLDLFNIRVNPETIGKLLEKQKAILTEKLNSGQIRNELAKTLVFRTYDELTDKQMAKLTDLTKVRKQRGKVINAHLRKLAKEHLRYDVMQQKLLTFYAARHTYATVLLKHNAPISLISEALGHADTRTTQVYLDSFAKSEIDQVNNFL